MSRTQQALAWLAEHPEATPYQAAQQFRLSPSVVYRAIAAARAVDRCPCCGQALRR